MKVRFNSGWAQVMLSLAVPIVGAIILLYSDVQELKSTKADKAEVSVIQVKFTEQITRNTVALENLDRTLQNMGGLNVKE